MRVSRAFRTAADLSGDWRISLWSTLSGNALSSALGSTTATSRSSTTAATTATTTTASPATTSPATTAQPTPGGYQPTNAVPASSAQKYIWAHVIMGNTYPYTYNMWMDDIRLASANGIDGFMLNLGPDSWQPARVQDAYNAARDSGTGFKVGPTHLDKADRR
jgi:glucan endo-1,3-alpha-glucosidase